jgi:hypothetical protein
VCSDLRGGYAFRVSDVVIHQLLADIAPRRASKRSVRRRGLHVELRA